MTVLVTGGAGFIGYHTIKALLDNHYEVVSLDNLNPYYDVDLKKARLASLHSLYPNKVASEFGDIRNPNTMDSLISHYQVDSIVHLAAQPGVRYSTLYPSEVMDINVTGTMRVFEAAKRHNVRKVIYASSSSVYGNEAQGATPEEFSPSKLLSYYAISKRTNELMADVYASGTSNQIVGLRFFTVYGPWGRPDMAYWSFADKIVNGEPITLFGDETLRDFTYCTDVADAIVVLLNRQLLGHTIFNIGCGKPVRVNGMAYQLGKLLEREVTIRRLALPDSDPKSTHSDTSLLATLTGAKPKVDFDTGIRAFVDWYKNYKKI